MVGKAATVAAASTTAAAGGRSDRWIPEGAFNARISALACVCPLTCSAQSGTPQTFPPSKQGFFLDEENKALILVSS